MKKILIIAGSDPSGGAGIQADLKVVTAHKIYAASVITCLTSQNTQAVFDIHNPSIGFFENQLEKVLDDIKFDAIKIGMLGTSKIINSTAKILSKKANNIPIILDTVMVSTSGDMLLEKKAVEDLKSKLIKNSLLVTPNIDEAEVLAKMKIKTLSDIKKAAAKIKKLGVKNVLIKGGHINLSKDFIYSILLDQNDEIHLIKSKKIKSKKQFHGTGCSLASAISCNIAKDFDVIESCRKANRYIYHSIKNGLKVGKGSLVLRHF